MGGLNMRFTTGFSLGTALLAVGYLGPAPSAGQLNAAGDSEEYPERSAGEPELQVVVVNGYRQSLADAQSKKRTASQIVDSIVADDIGKLPDTNTAEALQRVPGVQINTHLGAGSNVVIRGLGQDE